MEFNYLNIVMFIFIVLGVRDCSEDHDGYILYKERCILHRDTLFTSMEWRKVIAIIKMGSRWIRGRSKTKKIRDCEKIATVDVI